MLGTHARAHTYIHTRTRTHKLLSTYSPVSIFWYTICRIELVTEVFVDFKIPSSLLVWRYRNGKSLKQNGPIPIPFEVWTGKSKCGFCPPKWLKVELCLMIVLTKPQSFIRFQWPWSHFKVKAESNNCENSKLPLSVNLHRSSSNSNIHVYPRQFHVAQTLHRHRHNTDWIYMKL